MSHLVGAISIEDLVLVAQNARAGDDAASVVGFYAVGRIERRGRAAGRRPPGRRQRERFISCACGAIVGDTPGGPLGQRFLAGHPRAVLVRGSCNSLLGKRLRSFREDCQPELPAEPVDESTLDVAALVGVRAQVRAPPDLLPLPAALSLSRVIRPRLQTRGACGPAQLVVEARKHHVVAQRGDCVLTGQGCRELHRIVRP